MARKPINITRAELEQYYLTKFKNIFMTKYNISGLSRFENDFIFNRLFEAGKIASFQDNEQVLVMVGDFAPIKYDYLMQPLVCKAIPINYSSAFPLDRELIRDNSIALCYISRDKRKSIRQFLTPIIKNIVDVDMTIRKNLRDCKIGVVFTTTLENQNAIKSFYNKLVNDDDGELDIAASEVNSIVPIVANSQYLGQDLTELREYYINEALTIIGVDNLTINKKERLNLDETNANNDIINLNGDMVKDALEIWIDDTNRLFGANWSLEVKEPKVTSLQEDDIEEEEENV